MTPPHSKGRRKFTGNENGRQRWGATRCTPGPHVEHSMDTADTSSCWLVYLVYEADLLWGSIAAVGCHHRSHEILFCPSCSVTQQTVNGAPASAKQGAGSSGRLGTHRLLCLMTNIGKPIKPQKVPLSNPWCGVDFCEASAMRSTCKGLISYRKSLLLCGCPSSAETGNSWQVEPASSSEKFFLWFLFTRLSNLFRHLKIHSQMPPDAACIIVTATALLLVAEFLAL